MSLKIITVKYHELGASCKVDKIKRLHANELLLSHHGLWGQL